MSKVLIRTRQIDNNKQLTILIRENDDLSDFNEYSNVSRSSQILTGMDKGEESEHHLQEVLRELQYEKTTVNTAIPIPEVHEEFDYELLYQEDFTIPKNYIRLKTLEFEDECPEYDLDEVDREWLENSKLLVSATKFEKIVEEFERACSQKALLLDEAKSLLRHEPVHIVIAIYDYWLTKRVRTGQPLFLSVKAEKAERCNNTPIDPYIAFRKRSEKMTTRKNRRVDESSYEKMFRLRYHMEKLSETIESVSQRESTKRQITETERDIFIKRYQSRDYDKLPLKETEKTLKSQSIKMSDNFKSAQRSREENHKETKRKRPSSKTLDNGNCLGDQFSEDIDFAFKPMAKCKYLPYKNVSETKFLDSDDKDSKSFSLSKLLHLCPSLHPLNTPVRLRKNRNGHISIDLSNSPPPIQKSSSSPHNTHHVTHQKLVSPSSSSSPVFQGSHQARSIMTALYTLYNRDINCGLPPLNVHINTNCDSPHNISPSTQYYCSLRTSSLSLSPTSLSDNHDSDAGSRFNHQQQQQQSTNSVNHQSSSSSSLLVLSNQHGLVNDEHSKCPPLMKKPPSNNIESSHQNGNNCTYQNPSVITTDFNKNHAFNDFDRQINGQRRSSPSTKELVGHHSNHSLNIGFPSKLSQVVSLNCLKSLTNKRLIPRDDIDEIANFYSKSNGHHKKWLKGNTQSDNCLKSPPPLLPLWKSEPAHVMTSVNKMA